MLVDFDDANHNEVDDSTETVGDRRQEIVLIGPQLGRRDFQEEICSSLDKCLLTDDEWATYKAAKRNDNELAAAFFSPIVRRTVTY